MTTNTIAPDTYIIALDGEASVFYKNDGMGIRHMIAVSTRIEAEAKHYPTREQAANAAARLQCMGYFTEVRCIRGKVVLSADAKAAVAARRAARNAGRKF